MATTNTEQLDLVESALLEVGRWTNRSPELKAIDREVALRSLIKGRELPAGKTLEDVVAGTWPGDESDADIEEALKRLS